MSNQGTLFILSAPSGAGKSSLIKALLDSHPDGSLAVSVSHTTRAPRPGEENGIHYHFVDHAKFELMIEDDDFFEWAKVFDNYYGTSIAAIQDKLNAGVDVFLDIDWQGARQVKTRSPEAVGIFILPPSKKELLSRLRGRGQDSEETIQKRMDKAVSEMEHYDEADYLLINDDFEVTLQQLRSIVWCSRQKLAKQAKKHQDLLKDLLAKD